jgi:hypothetical protein
MGYLSKEEAREALKERTEQDFGFDADKWKVWLKENMPFRDAFEGILVALATEHLPEDSFAMPREVAYKRLKNETGQDFGYDVEKWREWLWNNRATLLKGKELDLDD